MTGAETSTAAAAFAMVGGALIILGIGVAYMLPAILAIRARHRSTAAIIIVNVLFGWTMIGWIAALIWACSTPSAPVGQPGVIYIQPYPSKHHWVEGVHPPAAPLTERRRSGEPR